MIDELQQLEHLALASRNKKGRMDVESRSKATELIVKIWLDIPDQAGETIRYFEDLQSEAVADAVGKLWPLLSPAARIQLVRSIQKPTSERAMRRLSLYISEVINHDADIALKWLQLLLPREKEYPAKDVRQSIVATLFASGQIVYSFTATNEEQAWEVARIYRLLWDIGKDSPTPILSMSRARLAAGIARHVSTHPMLRSRQSRVLEDAERESRAWPKELRDMWENESSSIQDIAQNEAPKTPSTTTENSQQTPAPLDPGVQKNQSSPAGDLRLDAAVEDRTSVRLPRQEDRATDDADLRALQLAIEQEAEKLAMLKGLKRRLDGSASELKEAMALVAERTKELNHALGAARQSASEADQARKELDRQRLIFVTERSALQTESDREKILLSQQVSANAEGRIEEFRNRLGSSLSKLLIDLPGKDVQMSSELGEAILLLFHQFIEAIQNAEVPIDNGRGRV